jgi:PIN domain nuclease of toxin-antitoxin system
MRYLLDTHVWLWLTVEPERLDKELLLLLAQPSSKLHLSVASAWEIGIKFALGKIELPQSPELFIPSRLARDKISSLSVEMSHALKAAALPPIHKDPFDRLLVAQAQSTGLQLVTHDSWAQQYEVDYLAV